MLPRVVSVPFEAAARLRHGRALHRRGRTYAATLRVTETLPGLAAEHSYDVIARLSKGASTPGGIMDVLGVALRVSTDDGPLDLLFASAGRLPGLRHVLLPRVSYTRGGYSTLLPYDVAGERLVLGLLPTTRRTVHTRDEDLNAGLALAPLTFGLATASLTGAWHTRGVLEVRRPPVRELPDAFDPQLNALPELRPAGPLRTVRRWAYEGSRQGREEPAPKEGSLPRR